MVVFICTPGRHLILENRILIIYLKQSITELLVDYKTLNFASIDLSHRCSHQQHRMSICLAYLLNINSAYAYALSYDSLREQLYTSFDLPSKKSWKYHYRGAVGIIPNYFARGNIWALEDSCTFFSFFLPQTCSLLEIHALNHLRKHRHTLANMKISRLLLLQY